MTYNIRAQSEFGKCEYKMDFAEDKIKFIAGGDYSEAFFSIEIEFENWEKDCYIMMPACVYNGNRFKRVKRSYPPMYRPEETGVDCEPLMTNLPAFNVDGSGVIEVTSGDMSVPCVGIYFKEAKRGFLIFTEQEIKGKNIGFSLSAGKLIISYPAKREYMYRAFNEFIPAEDCGIAVGKNEEIESRLKIFKFSCKSINEFYAEFFSKRKYLLKDKRAPFAYSKKLWDIMEKMFQEKNWNGKFLRIGTSDIWQCGWIGGGMSTYSLLRDGNKKSKEYAIKTIDYMIKYQAPSGFFYGTVVDDIPAGDGFGMAGMENVHLVRKSADALYFLFKHFEIVNPEKKWIEAAKRCADAFLRLYKKYGGFGFLVDIISGDIIVGCGCGGASGIAALVCAWDYFGAGEYLEAAKAVCDKYFNEYVSMGYTSGAPGEALNCPDSESAFGMLEACVVLYEKTNEEKWLEYAEVCARFCSSWVVTYSYKFPRNSEFSRLGINTVGSVFANVQNKHSAPGICTFSGDSLYKLYHFTGRREYLELIKDIAYFIPQCVSTNERPLYTFDIPSNKQYQGAVNERVNMSDWEGERCVGGIFTGSCWCETSLMLSFSELMCYDDMMEV